MIVRGVLAFALLLAAGYGLAEARRWHRPATRALLSAYQRKLRAWGLFLLLLTLALFLGGTFLPKPHTKLATLHALIFWTATTLCAVPLIPLALLDARENLRRLLEGRRELAEQRVQIAREFILPPRPGPPDPAPRDDAPGA